MPGAVHRAVTAPGPGNMLAPDVATRLGRGLGVDPSPVRVHTDSLSASATAELGVRAFTWGVDVFLAKGERPTDVPLLAHEVTHAIQQSGGPAIHLFDGPHGELEHEAHRNAAVVADGGQAAVHGRTSGLLQAVLQEIRANLTTIYTEIRDVAHYHGLLIALTYYSISYSDPAEVAGTEALNSAIASVTEKFGGKVADGFAALEDRLRPSRALRARRDCLSASRRNLQHPSLACRAPVAGPGHRGRHIGVLPPK